MESIPHPGFTDSSGQPLFTDLAFLGDENSERAIVLISGTHGVEGYCGSGAQINFVQQVRENNDLNGCAALLLHAINPYGFAHDRRVNEDNVDLNRNFVDFAAPLPENNEYEVLHQALVPKHWDGNSRQLAEKEILAYIELNGERAYQAAVVGGQYLHADGLFYGGKAPVWSNKLWKQIVSNHLKRFRKIALIDYHTGLGTYGHGELICTSTAESPAMARAMKWFGDDVTCPTDGASVSTAIAGPLASSLDHLLPEAEITAVALEFGTYPVQTVLNALRADNWLHTHGIVDTPTGRDIKKEIKRAFYPQEESWKNSVLSKSLEVISRAIGGLSL